MALVLRIEEMNQDVWDNIVDMGIYATIRVSEREYKTCKDELKDENDIILIDKGDK